MPSELLFDIEGIDRNAVAISAERIGQLNPQSGAMRQLDHVIWVNDALTEGLGVKYVRDDEFWVPGHIPGRPLLPGVLMIEAAGQLSNALYQSRVDTPRFMAFTRADDVVFRGQVVPGDTLYLLVKELDFRPRRFVSVAQGLVNDKLVFECKITGMTI